ncbi:glycosyltransferase family 4 protein [Actinobacillus vicugnae]|uniref:glycosyltransferase family 4 protein n=1 Tax=Actinobacillus vicugnae TaxID=2573093 RepID=UPI001242753E|nr:glycosyltransferase family 4 protein [Actinobacillus vicugnae]
MRIAYICADPGIPVFGTKGASVHVQEVIKGMLARGHEVTLFAQRLGGDAPEELKEINIKKFAKLPKTSKEERAQTALAANTANEEMLGKYGPFDLVYERYSLWSNVGMTFAKKHHIMGLLEVNAPLIEEQKKHRELPLEQEAKKIAHAVFNDADAIIAVSPGVKHYLEAFAKVGHKTHVIANGVALDRFLPAATKNTERLSHLKQTVEQHQPVTVGFLGTLKPWHGLATLVQAWRLLREQDHNVRLLIVGDGPEFEPLNAEINQLNLADYVTFAGAVQPEDVPQWLAQMDIAVAPYPQLENFYFSPLKIYEYMAAALPIITTNVGHLPTVVEHNHNGILVEPENPQKMARGILSLIKNPAKTIALGKAARLTAEQRHSWLSVVDQILDIAHDCKER